jgi:hypothetical protein
MAGPYKRKIDTDGEPVMQAVSTLHPAREVPSCDPEHLVRDTIMGYLTAACRDTEIELGGWDRHALERLADSNDAATQAVLGMITRAYDAGLAIRA